MRTYPQASTRQSDARLSESVSRTAAKATPTVNLDVGSDGASTSAAALCAQLCSDSVADWDLPGISLFTAASLSLLSPPVRASEAPGLRTLFGWSQNRLGSGADGAARLCAREVASDSGFLSTFFRDCSGARMCLILGPTERDVRGGRVCREHSGTEVRLL